MRQRSCQFCSCPLAASASSGRSARSCSAPPRSSTLASSSSTSAHSQPCQSSQLRSRQVVSGRVKSRQIEPSPVLFQWCAKSVDHLYQSASQPASQPVSQSSTLWSSMTPIGAHLIDGVPPRGYVGLDDANLPRRHRSSGPRIDCVTVGACHLAPHDRPHLLERRRHKRPQVGACPRENEQRAAVAEWPRVPPANDEGQRTSEISRGGHRVRVEG